MKSRIFAICIASGFAIVTTTNAGLAADMAIKAPPAVPAAAYGWTGWYAGLNVGDSWGESKNTYLATLPAPTPAGADATQVDGIIGGRSVRRQLAVRRLGAGY